MQLLYQHYVRHYDNWSVENPGKNISKFIEFIWSVIIKMLHLALTQIYLSNVEKGSGVMCRNMPSLLVKGRLQVGNNVRIWSNIQQTRLSVFNNAEMIIGKGTYINGARISAKKSVVIGANCTIAPEVLIMDSDFHDMNDHSKEGLSKPIIIEDHVWIATRAIIMKGITIGEHAVVAAAAVVTKDVPPYTVVAGNPARIIKELR